MRSYCRLILQLLLMFLPVSLSARVITSEEYNGITYTMGYVCDFQVDGISYTIHENGVYVSAEKYLCDSAKIETFLSSSPIPYEAIEDLLTIPWEIVVNNSYKGEVTIPKTVMFGDTVYNVTGIDDAAFKGCVDLYSVYFPNSVEYIGSSAFYGCLNLESISFPEKLRIIGAESFARCKKLKRLIFPDELERIETYAFLDCTGVKLLNIPASVSYIGMGVFGNCPLDSLFWNTSDVSAQTTAFQCHSLKYVRLGDEVTKIYPSSFDYCTSLSSIIIPEKVEYIDQGAFAACQNLKKIVIEGSPVIYEHAFILCPLIDTIILKSRIPPIVKDRTYTAYGYLDGFHEVFFAEEPYKNAQLIVPESSLSEYMSSRFWSFFCKISTFYDGDYESDSEDDTISIIVQEDGDTTCYNIQEDGDTIYYSIQEDGDTIYYTVSDDGAYVVSNAICRDGFYSRYGFDGPLTPRDPIAGGQQPRVIIRGTPEFTTADTKDYTSYRGRIVIPESIMYNDTSYSVTGIKYYAFVGCKELESVSIPENVRNLGYGSFAGCSVLSTVNIPASVNEIPDALFYGCSSLGGIEIPSGVKIIGYSAFYECSGLTEITIPAGVELIDEYAFAYCSGLKRVVIEGNPVIAETAFIGCGTELEVIRGREDNDGERDSDGCVKSHYSIEGLRISDDTPGLHIIKYRNGIVRKAVVR